MIHEAVVIAYRLIVLFVLIYVVRATLARGQSRTFQFMAAVLTIPLVLRLFMIK